MDSRRLGFVLGVVLGLCPSVAMQADGSEDEKPLYKDATAPVERRVDDLLRRMTLEEKVMQVNQYSLGRNNNENNAGAVARVPAEIGSVIYYDQDPALRNDFQRKAVEQTRLGIRLRPSRWPSRARGIPNSSRKSVPSRPSRRAVPAWTGPFRP